MCLNLVKTSDGSKTKCKLEDFHHTETKFNYICNNTKTSFTLFEFKFQSPPDFILNCIGSDNDFKYLDEYEMNSVFKNLDEYKMNSVGDKLKHLHWNNRFETDFTINDVSNKCIDKNGGWSKINSLINSNALSTVSPQIGLIRIV